MKYLIAAFIFVSTSAFADDSPYCLTKAHLARDMSSQLMQGLDPSKINFAFPNVRNEEQARQAKQFADEIMAEVMELMKTEDDSRKIYEIVKERCNESISDAI